MGQDEWLGYAKTLSEEGQDAHLIEAQLLERGLDSYTIDLILKEIDELKQHKKRQRGILLVTVGSLLLLCCTLFMFLMYSNEDAINYPVYGLSLLGLIVIMIGVVEIFGI